MDPVRAVVGTSGLAPKALHTSFSVVSTPVAKRPRGDAEEFADLRRPNSFLEMLLDGVQSETNILLDQGHPFPGAAICPDNSDGKMSCYCTARASEMPAATFAIDKMIPIMSGLAAKRSTKK